MNREMWKWFLLFSTIVIALYSKTLSYPFINFDDWWIVHNAELGQGVFDFSKEARMKHGAEFLPMRDISAALQHHFFGNNTTPYRFVQLALYLLATWCMMQTLLILGFARETLFVAAALFLLHPLHVEPVVWLSSHKDMLCYAFISLSLLSYAKRSTGYAVLFFVLAIFSKYYILCCAPLFPLIDWTMNKTWNYKKAVPFFLVSMMTALLSFYVSSVVQYGHLESNHQAWLYFPGLIALSFQKWSWPHPLHLLYHESLPRLGGGLWFLGLALLISLLLYVWIHRNSLRHLAFPLALLIFTLLPTLKAPQMHLLADRYFLLPSLGLTLLLCQAATVWIKNKFVYGAIFAVISVTFGVLTFRQSDVWSDSTTLWEHAARFEPLHPVTMKNLAGLYQQQQKWDQSLYYYRKLTDVADKRDAEYAVFWMNRGSVAMQKNLLPEAEQAFEKSVFSKPSYIAYLNLGASLAMQKKYEGAKHAFERAHALSPKAVDPLWNLVLLHAEQQKFHDAKRYADLLKSLIPQNDPRRSLLNRLEK